MTTKAWRTLTQWPFPLIFVDQKVSQKKKKSISRDCSSRLGTLSPVWEERPEGTRGEKPLRELSEGQAWSRCWSLASPWEEEEGLAEAGGQQGQASIDFPFDHIRDKPMMLTHGCLVPDATSQLDNRPRWLRRLKVWTWMADCKWLRNAEMIPAPGELTMKDKRVGDSRILQSRFFKSLLSFGS